MTRSESAISYGGYGIYIRFCDIGIDFDAGKIRSNPEPSMLFQSRSSLPPHHNLSRRTKTSLKPKLPPHTMRNGYHLLLEKNAA